MNPEFLLWYENISRIDLIITILLSIIVFVPPIAFLGMFLLSFFYHSDSGTNTNDIDGCL